MKSLYWGFNRVPALVIYFGKKSKSENISENVLFICRSGAFKGLSLIILFLKYCVELIRTIVIIDRWLWCQFVGCEYLLLSFLWDSKLIVFEAETLIDIFHHLITFEGPNSWLIDDWLIDCKILVSCRCRFERMERACWSDQPTSRSGEESCRWTVVSEDCLFHQAADGDVCFGWQ